MPTVTIATLPYLSFLGYPDLWNGDTADGTASASAALQAAINATDGVLDLKPGATYLISTTVTLKSNLTIRGNGATIKKNGTAGEMLEFVGANLTNLTIMDCIFDGSLTWPGDETTDKNNLSPVTTAIYLAGANHSNITIIRNKFNEISGGSIRMVPQEGQNIRISDNIFTKGHFQSKAISVFAVDPENPYNTPKFENVEVTGNVIIGGGPTAWVDATVEGYVNSADGIHVDNTSGARVSNNVIRDVASNGIRMERSFGFSIDGNQIYSPGQQGIVCYLSCENGGVRGNYIEAWGRFPHIYTVFDYEGTLVSPTESPHVSLAPFPADPTASSWWQTWPYATTGTTLATIKDYADKAYYSGYSTGALPFRGFAAIAVTHNSGNITVLGNVVIPDLTQESGKYTHASDYGYAGVHPVNSPVDSASLPLGVALGNILDGRLGAILAPTYMDPINERGTVGTLVQASNPTP